MIKQSMIIAGVVLGLNAGAAAANDSAVCIPTPELEASLVDWYNETLVSQESDDTYVWASGIGGTWTIVTYNPTPVGEVACVIAQGDNWQPGYDEDVLLAMANVSDVITQ